MQLDFHKVVINLPERAERLERFNMNFNRLHPDDTFRVVNGVRMKPVHVGIAEAHLNCIRLAKQEGWDKVLIMEDDLLVPNIKANEYMTSALNKLPEDWDVALAGVYWKRSEIKINNYWKKLSEFCSLHWYLVNSKAYDKLLTYDGSNHYDRWIGTQGFNVYCTNKYFAIQYDGWSDNVNQETKYNDTYIKKQDLL